MNRRQIFSALGLCALFPRLVPKYESIGLMTHERWWAERRNEQGYKVLLDGVDITHGCVWFSDCAGEAYCYKRDGQGNFYVVMVNGEQEIAGQLLKGTIRVVRDTPRQTLVLA